MRNEVVYVWLGNAPVIGVDVGKIRRDVRKFRRAVLVGFNALLAVLAVVIGRRGSL